MLIVGITGIIGSGKSTVTEIFRKKYKALAIDADKLGHELLASDVKVMQKIISKFKTNIRSQLAKIVFNNPQELKELNKITHPAIRKIIKDIIKANSDENLIVIDAALLFTIGLHKFCNKTIFIEADKDNITNRLIKRNLKPKEIELRLRANLSVLKLKQRCNFVIENNYSKKDLFKKIATIYTKLFQ